MFGHADVSALALPQDAMQWSSAIQGTLLAFFAFIGFESIANLSEEAHDPERAVPRAIVWTLFITLAIYILVALAVEDFWESDRSSDDHVQIGLLPFFRTAGQEETHGT